MEKAERQTLAAKSFYSTEECHQWGTAQQRSPPWSFADTYTPFPRNAVNLSLQVVLQFSPC